MEPKLIHTVRRKCICEETGLWKGYENCRRRRPGYDSGRASGIELQRVRRSYHTFEHSGHKEGDHPGGGPAASVVCPGNGYFCGMLFRFWLRTGSCLCLSADVFHGLHGVWDAGGNFCKHCFDDAFSGRAINECGEYWE